MHVTVLSPGFLTSVQDAGRIGFREIGVSAGGALDSHALSVANILVGNNAADAGLEITLGGLRLRFDDTRLIAWCGGAFEVRIGDVLLSAGRPAIIRAGEELVVKAPEIGCRAWLAISGGIDVPEVLGSRSTDLRACFGGHEGRALRAGDSLKLHDNPARSHPLLARLAQTRVAPWLAPVYWRSPAQRHPVLRVMRSSEWSQFGPDNQESFRRQTFAVTPQADRMGVRLEGSKLNYKGPELLSEAVTAGTIQVPPSGDPIILLPDCQTIGGYPKLAHVITADLPIAAQLRPGDQVRFREVVLAEAHRVLLQRERELALFRIGIAFRAP